MNGRLSRLALLLVVAVLAAVPGSFAAGQPALLQSDLRQPEKIWVGQRLDLNVTLFTTSSFAGVPRFDLPQDAGLAMIADDAHPLLGTKTIDGVDYITKQYDISIFPLRSGALAVPAFTVEFGYLGDAGQEVDTALSTAAAALTVLDVPGADAKLPLVTATDLAIDDRWDPSPDKAAVGDAFTRTIALRATGVPGLALPPLRLAAGDGLAVYAAPPQVATDTARGDFIGKRVETFSLVCQKAGTYTLPEMPIQWWNPTEAVLRVVKLRSVTLRVAPNPVLDASPPGGAARGLGAPPPWGWIVAALLAVLAAAAGAMLLQRKRRRLTLAGGKTEKALFRTFKRAAVANDPAQTMQALARWFDAAGRSGGCGSLSACVARFGDPAARQQFAALEASVYGRQHAPWSGDSFPARMAAVRKRCLPRPAHREGQEALGPLNP